MRFDSFDFLVFFTIFFLLYLPSSPRVRLALLLQSSVIFYMWLIPKYILILILIILIDYTCGLKIEKSFGLRRKLWLLLSLSSTSAVLFFFKYYDFFASEVSTSLPLLKWALPIGLSFHTFQSLSYVIEVYKKKQKAEKNFAIYSLYVLFFPQLVAGPIERPRNLLRQFHAGSLISYEQLTDGARLIAWGLFKKIAVADRLGKVVDSIYENPAMSHGAFLLTASFLFSFQIYADFSGYTDIARGLAKMLGYELTLNFKTPYFSKSITEFWRRWHISLSSWFKDYLYSPLGGNRNGLARWSAAIVITFAISGLWHGANWTFLVWGLLNGLFLMVEKLKDALLKGRFQLPVPFKIFCVFSLITFSWVFFRAPNMNSAFLILEKIIGFFMEIPTFDFSKALRMLLKEKDFVFGVIALILLLIVEVLYELGYLKHSRFKNWNWSARWPLYFCLVASIITLGGFDGGNFIYFQF